LKGKLTKKRKQADDSVQISSKKQKISK
jgi:hypothetical protein